ncbi:chromosome partition protein Smc [Nanobdella aerobiophila]|uniref:Chromosome partition protein Smc n=1 Tax=Nanobdella aerobiophila TaxID=2586965 RepID=A0A915WSF1_9ARCH|nr:hypothetical protein [Nanobdella aerobiophila]BBL45235.1 chromosome partition protein Smc [Nanobdella aerobiophila]
MSDIDRTYKGILSIKRELIRLGEEKEQLYSRKRTLYKERKELISRLKELRTKKEEYSVVLDNLMEERQKTLQKLEELKNKLNSIKQEKKDVFKNKDILKDINRYKKELETLEYVLQTEILSYSQEKKIWNRIKYLRKLLGKYEQLSSVLEEIDKIKEEYNAYKSKLSIIGQNIRKNIDERKVIKEQLKSVKEKLLGLISEYNSLKQQIMETKDKIKSLEDKLREQLEVYLNQLSQKPRLEVSGEEKTKILDEYSRIQEKIVNGGELSMDDILVMQKYELLKKKGAI